MIKMMRIQKFIEIRNQLNQLFQLLRFSFKIIIN